MYICNIRGHNRIKYYSHWFNFLWRALLNQLSILFLVVFCDIASWYLSFIVGYGLAWNLLFSVCIWFLLNFVIFVPNVGDNPIKNFWFVHIHVKIYSITGNFACAFHLAIFLLKSLLPNLKFAHYIQLSRSEWRKCTHTGAHMTTRVLPEHISVLNAAHKLFADRWSPNVLENVMATDTAANFLCFHRVLI